MGCLYLHYEDAEPAYTLKCVSRSPIHEPTAGPGQ